MAKYPNITLTNAGLNMIAESQGSGQLIFTNIKLGDSSLNVGEDIRTLNDVKNPLLIADISAVDDTTVSGQITLTAVISNAAVTIGFFARELGIYAKVGSDGAEKLYAYTNAGNYADYMPDKNTPINENQIKITLIVGNASNVTALINSSIVYTTLAQVQTEIQTHDAKTEAHSDAFNAHNNDTASHADIRALLKKAGAMPLGTILPFLMKSPPAGWLALDTGALVSRATYPDLWTWVQSNAPLISETDWQTQAAAQTSIDSYSTGDGSTNFRLPKMIRYSTAKRYIIKEEHGLTGTFTVTNSNNGNAVVSCTNFWYRLYNDGYLEQGGTLTQTVTGNNAYGKVTFPVEFKDTSYSVYRNAQYASTYDTTYSDLVSLLNCGFGTKLTTSVVFQLDNLNASREFSWKAEGYAKNLPTAVPSNMLYCVKAFDSAVNQGTVDITAMANELLGKVDKTTYAANFASVLGTNGYQKLPSGMILQWGVTPNIAGGDTVTPITFPIAFPNNVFSVIACNYNGDTGIGHDTQLQVATVSLSGANITNNYFGAGATPALKGFYMAIGN